MNAQSLNYDNYDGIAGVDEVGRGAIAGPIVAAAVILPRHQDPIFKDSKKISSYKRRQFYRILKASGADIGIGIASPREIEKLNVHFASLIAMKRAIERLSSVPLQVLVDGIFLPDFNGPIRAIAKGDERIQPISAASIVAKVFRDYLMVRLGRRFPLYGLREHKGYPTKKHKIAIKEHGILKFHRRTFEPVRGISLRGEG